MQNPFGKNALVGGCENGGHKRIGTAVTAAICMRRIVRVRIHSQNLYIK